MSWNCPENKSVKQRGAHGVEANDDATKTNIKEETHNLGESLMLKRALIKG